MIQFENGEKIVKIVRRHYFVIMPMVFLMVLLALAPMIVINLLSSGFLPLDEGIKNMVEVLVSKWKVFGYSLWLLLLWILFFIEWTDYYLDLWVITDRRIVDVDQRGFFHREVTSFKFEQIQDITVETKGLVETFFKFGTLHIQTAGHNREIVIRDAHLPEDARTLILQLSEKLKSISIQ
ncbi:MAG: PH domain-containing protein [Candidatus Paceibacterota bacterium]|jgi:uncharacterized membrane protein YdbT with pleckstrin-like domain